MCGICGLINNTEIQLPELKKMNDTMRHRGPDDSGEQIFFQNGKYVGLAQRRLAIQDLSQWGHQPMSSHDKSVWIVFNGEIYNFRELRKELGDYPFVSRCDTEVILAMYLKYGIKCLNYFNGMFAIAIYDRNKSTLFLARDRMGKKPLYYSISDGNIIFASELKPLFAYSGFEGEIDRGILKSYLFHGYIKGPETIFKNVKKLRPGSYLEYKEGKIQEIPYWNLKKVYQDGIKTQETDYETAKKELKRKLKKAVEYRMIADVPVGSFLSGGYDSSLITAIAQETAGEAVHTYSIGFEDPAYDEAPYAREVARHLQTKHTEYYVDAQDVFRMLDGLTYYYDEPFADSSQIPSMLVAQLARKDVKVVLSGDGGDELFCGYSHYAAARKLQYLEPFIRAAGTVIRLPLVSSSSFWEKLPTSVQGMIWCRDRRYKVQNFNRPMRIFCDILSGDEEDVYFPEELGLKFVKDWQTRRMLLDMETYLVDDILCKVDRATMKYALEARCPILDKEVVEFSFRLPHSFKYDGGNGKRILKDIAYDYIPENMLDRPKKGFSVPLTTWLKGILKEELLKYTDRNYLLRQGLFDTTAVEKAMNIFWKDSSERADLYVNVVWHFFVLQRWYEKYCAIE